MRFGYILDMKVGEKKTWILLYCWLPTGTYHKNLMIWIIFFLWNLANLGLFSLENPFLKGGNHIYIFSGWHLVTFLVLQKPLNLLELEIFSAPESIDIFANFICHFITMLKKKNPQNFQSLVTPFTINFKWGMLNIVFKQKLFFGHHDSKPSVFERRIEDPRTMVTWWS